MIASLDSLNILLICYQSNKRKIHFVIVKLLILRVFFVIKKLGKNLFFLDKWKHLFSFQLNKLRLLKYFIFQKFTKNIRIINPLSIKLTIQFPLQAFPNLHPNKLAPPLNNLRRNHNIQGIICPPPRILLLPRIHPRPFPQLANQQLSHFIKSSGRLGSFH